MILVAALAGDREFHRVADVLSEIPSLCGKLLYTDTVFISSPYRCSQRFLLFAYVKKLRISLHQLQVYDSEQRGNFFMQ
jgi:hypothetical protein